MLVSRTSPRTGEENIMELPLTDEEFITSLREYLNGKLIHEAFPTLNNTQREFIMTGYTQEDWDNIFPKEEEEEDKQDQDVDSLYNGLAW